MGTLFNVFSAVSLVEVLNSYHYERKYSVNSSAIDNLQNDIIITGQKSKHFECKIVINKCFGCSKEPSH